MFDDDFFEEDGFDEDILVESKQDEDTEYVLELMQYGVDTCEEAVQIIERLVEINELFGGAEVTGVASELLDNLKSMYSTIVPDLIVGENLDRMIQSVQVALSTTESVAKEYIDDRRTKVLENLDNNRK